MANNSNLSRRAALRKQQELEARRKRNTRMIGIGLGVLALVIAGIFGYVIWNTMSDKAPDKAPAAEQLTPPNATEGHGIAIKSKSTQPAGDVPNVVLYEDSQCPICKDYETQFGNAMLQLIDEGKITLEVRTAYFLDYKIQQTPNKKSSQRAAMAAAADAVGKYREYHKVVYENQPPEGVGYTDQQLRVDFAAKAGITGDDLATFQNLYDTKAYANFAKDSNDAMRLAGVEGTPTYVVNGKRINLGGLRSNDPQTVLTAIQTAASGSN